MDITYPTKQVNIRASGYNIDDIRNIFLAFQKLVTEQGDIEISGITKAPDKSEEEFEQFKKQVRTAFDVRVTVIRADGSSTIGDNIDVVTIKPNGPIITKIYMSNAAPFQNVVGTNPSHSFELLLDFSVPPLLDPVTPASGATPNNSLLTISGDRAGWIAGAERAYSENIRKNFTWRAVLHRPFIYDAGLIPIAIPGALYACWLTSGWIESFFSGSAFLSSAAYIYIFAMAVWAYRILFSYTKWAFPMLEIIDQPNTSYKHRLILGGITFALAGAFFWNSLEPYLSVQAIMEWLNPKPPSTAS